MSRLCRLKTASHGDDGQWAHNEIVSLRKQRDELLEQVECSNITEKNMEGRLNKLIVQNAATKDRLDELLAALERFMDSHEECTDFGGFTARIVSMGDYHKLMEAVARAKGEQ